MGSKSAPCRRARSRCFRRPVRWRRERRRPTCMRRPAPVRSRRQPDWDEISSPFLDLVSTDDDDELDDAASTRGGCRAGGRGSAPAPGRRPWSRDRHTRPPSCPPPNRCRRRLPPRDDDDDPDWLTDDGYGDLPDPRPRCRRGRAAGRRRRSPVAPERSPARAPARPPARTSGSRSAAPRPAPRVRPPPAPRARSTRIATPPSTWRSPRSPAT